MRKHLRDVAYLAALLIALPWLLYRRAVQQKPTSALWAKLTGHVISPRETDGSRRIWLHAVSVGEVLQARSVIDRLRGIDPAATFFISATTASGLNVAREKYPDCDVIPFPFDFTWAVEAALDRVRPNLILLVELELWPGFVESAARRGIPVAVINGRLSEKSFRGYRRVAWLVRPVLRKLSLVCVQSAVYRDRFVALGAEPERVCVTGSIKFDGLQVDRDREEVRRLREAFGLGPGKTFVAGSTHPPEEADALAAWEAARREDPSLQLILVPRHPERFESVAAMVAQRGYSVIRRSRAEDQSATPASPADVRLLDTVGELSACWALADVALVGGTFTPRGGQNMLEPAAYGVPLILGPNVWNFQNEADALVEQGATRTCRTAEETAAALRELVTDDALRQRMGVAGKRYALLHRGAADRTIALLRPLLPDQRMRAAA